METLGRNEPTSTHKTRNQGQDQVPPHPPQESQRKSSIPMRAPAISSYLEDRELRKLYRPSKYLCLSCGSISLVVTLCRLLAIIVQGYENVCCYYEGFMFDYVCSILLLNLQHCMFISNGAMIIGVIRIYPRFMIPYIVFHSFATTEYLIGFMLCFIIFSEKTTILEIGWYFLHGAILIFLLFTLMVVSFHYYKIR